MWSNHRVFICSFPSKIPFLIDVPLQETLLCSQIIDTFGSQLCPSRQLSFHLFPTHLSLSLPCSWLYPFISATCSAFSSDCISLFFLFHFLIKIYFPPSILLPFVSYFWAWWGFTHWQQSQNQLWDFVLLKDIAQMGNLATFCVKIKETQSEFYLSCLKKGHVDCIMYWDVSVAKIPLDYRTYCGSQNSHTVHQAQPASKVSAGTILLLGKEVKATRSRADPSWSQAASPPPMELESRSLLSAPSSQGQMEMIHLEISI